MAEGIFIPFCANKEEKMTQEKKKFNKKALLGVGILVVLIAVFAITYSVFREKPVDGSKSITIEVVNKAAQSTLYELETDALYLRQAMEEAAEEGLTFSGSESDFGMYVDTVNGETADYSLNGSYWSFYVNDTYCNLGIDSQPVNDGDAFKIVYEVYNAQ